MTLRDYAVFKDKAHRVLIFDRERFDAEPAAPRASRSSSSSARPAPTKKNSRVASCCSARCSSATRGGGDFFSGTT